MRIALIADIHGNLPAFNAVLADIKQAGIDQIVFLGDAVYFGPQPHECLRQLAALACPCVMGNADEKMLTHEQVRLETDDLSQVRPETQWTFDQLTTDDLDFIRTFEPRLEIDLGDGQSLLCFHGSPLSNKERIEPTITDEELEHKLAGYRAPVMTGGHTHFSMIRGYRGMLFVNPGSVGLPFERARDGVRDYILPWAEYGIISQIDGTLSLDLRRVSYDLEAIKQAARESGKPEHHHWIDDWVEVG